jgi:hypothetical protein
VKAGLNKLIVMMGIFSCQAAQIAGHGRYSGCDLSVSTVWQCERAETKFIIGLDVPNQRK